MTIAEQLQAIADNLATEHQEIATQAELLQQVKANLGGKAAPKASTSLYRHQITLSGNDDYIYLDGCECDPYIHIEIYNRNPNAMTVSDIVNGGHIPFVTCLPFYADAYDGRFSGRCTPLYFDADNGIIRIVIAPLNSEDSADYDLQIPMNYFYVNDTVTEV